MAEIAAEPDPEVHALTKGSLVFAAASARSPCMGFRRSRCAHHRRGRRQSGLSELPFPVEGRVVVRDLPHPDGGAEPAPARAFCTRRRIAISFRRCARSPALIAPPVRWLDPRGDRRIAVQSLIRARSEGTDEMREAIGSDVSAPSPLCRRAAGRAAGFAAGGGLLAPWHFVLGLIHNNRFAELDRPNTLLRRADARGRRRGADPPHGRFLPRPVKARRPASDFSSPAARLLDQRHKHDQRHDQQPIEQEKTTT